ncbi:MAG TPA: hypothetical protein EYH05_04040 [Anaerolineae bacterium]|nr:hypothetical protein [Anaerolineae bacterium]
MSEIETTEQKAEITEQKPKAKRRPPGGWIVNKRGIIHAVSKENEAELVKRPGYLRATTREIQAYLNANGHQTFDAPLAEPTGE